MPMNHIGSSLKELRRYGFKLQAHFEVTTSDVSCFQNLCSNRTTYPNAGIYMFLVSFGGSRQDVDCEQTSRD